jgi:hypothetical protein
MYGQQGRGYGAVVLPVDGEPILIVTAPYYEIGEVAIEDVRVSLNLVRSKNSFSPPDVSRLHWRMSIGLFQRSAKP